jgi:heme-binding NEAT domain protein
MPGAAAPPVQQAPAAPRVQNKPAAAPAPTAAPPPPPARPATVTADKAAKPDAANSPKAEAADATTTWAKHEHDRLRKLVSTGSCAAAAKVAVEIANRAPEYYAQNVANSRDVRQCQQYLDSARDKDAEATGKNRAKHTSPDEPAAATH